LLVVYYMVLASTRTTLNASKLETI
jgi:hypothetical protein